MNYRTFIAWQVWAIDTDQLSLPVDRAWEAFSKAAERIKRNYTDPDDPLLFSPKAVNQAPIEIITDYALWYAKTRIISAAPEERYNEYGKLTDVILKVA